MENNIGKYIRKIRNTKNALLISMLVGSLVGAAAMLFLAPQSGAQTRAQIRLRGIQMRDHAQMKRLSEALTARKTSVEAA